MPNGHAFVQAVCHTESANFLMIIQHCPQGYVGFMAGPADFWPENYRREAGEATGNVGRWVTHVGLWTKDVETEFYELLLHPDSLNAAVKKAQEILASFNTPIDPVQFFYADNLTFDGWGDMYIVHLTPPLRDQYWRLLGDSPLVRKVRLSEAAVKFWLSPEAQADVGASLQTLANLYPE